MFHSGFLQNKMNTFPRNTIFRNIYHSVIRLNHLGSISSRVPETVFIEKVCSEEPVIVIGEDDNVDIIGPPHPISNLRPIIRRRPINETALQQRLREMQNEIQEWNQNFWENHNTRFVKERQDYINSHLVKNKEKQQLSADEMSEFYKRFLDENWETHMRYNFEWYKKNFTLLFLSLGASVENFLKF